MQKMSMKTLEKGASARKDYIDLAKFVGIFAVVLGHVCDKKISVGSINYIVDSFHMPLFFLAYGAVAYKFPLPGFGKTFVKRFKGIYVPYLIWFAIGCTNWKPNFWLCALYGSNYAIGAGSSWQMLWFLPCMFLSSLLAYGIIWMFSRDGRKRYRLILPAIVLQLLSYILNRYNTFPLHMPFSFNVSLGTTAFILVGYMCANLLDKVDRSKAWLAIPAVIGIYISCKVAMQNTWVSIAISRYGNNYLYYLFTSHVMNACIFVLCKLACEFLPSFLKLFNYIGRHSLLFFAPQPLAFIMTDALFEKMKWGGVFTTSTVFVYTVISMILMLIWCVLINQFTPLLEGKEKSEALLTLGNMNKKKGNV